MLKDDGKPIVGSQRDMLGVRENGRDIPIDSGNIVHPGAGGLSVAPEWRVLPPFLIPRRLSSKVGDARGNAQLAIFRLGMADFIDSTIGQFLRLRVTSAMHGSIEPAMISALADYQAQLAATREEWVFDET
ncbi:MAG: hypothetical protein WD894_05730 [Pirellulales bacterium]